MLTLLSAAIAPTLALMTFFYLKDEFNEEPISSVVRTFLYGAILVFPIMFIQYAFEEEGIGQMPFIRSFVLIGLLEEFFKWFVFLYTVYKYTKFHSVYDGIIYGVSVSLGFATVENLLYLIANGIEFAFARALFPVSSHALFGVIMGYYMGKAKFERRTKKMMITIFIALIIPAILHGAYDFILATITSNWLYILIPFMIGLWINGLRKVKLANQLKHDQLVYFPEKSFQKME
ncbi:glutamic-type intramembrane protease PrsW [Aquibacillus salsiterrae]|uniref:Protease PrsW n=1 Tax=Aquibacillus salsiterrae TaxID=2950439 RepID=A0A9X3WDF4_9BACI|nr:glutamic-type intramembrane protease PrsW [Aquibacillus salsiterrae]MDC3415399.1 glutamic-type intramembrane protease PrsW [Aquibacillus salsiterrae]